LVSNPTDPNEDNFHLIRTEDFQSIRLHLSFENLTTQTKVGMGQRVYGGTKMQGSEADTVELIEFGDNTMTLDVPSRIASQGHQVMVYLQSENLNPDITFNATGKVLEAEKSDSPSRFKLKVQLVNYDEKLWNSLRTAFERKQEEASSLFYQIKGLE